MNKLQIREQVKALLNRNDVTNEQLDSFVDLALGRVQRTLRVPAMEAMFEGTFSDAFPDSFFLPDDFLEFVDVYTEAGGKLRYAPLGTFMSMGKGKGTPTHYTRLGNRVMLNKAPTVDSSVSLLYYQEFPDFTDDLSSNWLSEIAPEMLIYGALSLAADHFIDERREAFEQVYVRTYAELEAQAYQLEFSGGAMAIQPAHSDY